MPYKEPAQARIYKSQYYHLHKDEFQKYAREYRQNNKDKCRKYYLHNAEKIKAKARERHQKNRIRNNAQARIYQKNNPEKIKEGKKKYYEKNKVNVLSNHKKIRQQKRTELMNILGGTLCKQCGFGNQAALEIDHINNDGKGDRVIFRNSLSFLIHYVKHPIKARNNLQVLCANCHKLKQTVKEFLH